MPPPHEDEAFPAIAEKTRLKMGPTLTILGLALAMRVLVIWTVVTRYPPQWLFTRGMEMGLLAKSLLAGKGLSSPFGGDTGPTAIVAPVYPLLIAAVFRVFGAYSMASAIAILIAQTIVNLITIWMIMHVSRRLFNQATATVAGLAWACSLPLVWMPTILWETSLSCCLLAGLFAIVLKYRVMADMGPVQWIAIGGYCGLCALVNPALLLSLAGAALWLAYVARGRQSYWPLLSLLTFVLVFAPWPIRNARAFHAFVPLRTTVGLELWIGNRDGATGFLDESVFPMFNRTELADYVTRGEVGYSAHKSELAKQYIATHPLEFLELTARRFVRFWTGTGTQNGSALFALHATSTTLLGVIALALLLRRRRYDLVALFAIPMLLFPIPYLITHAEFRYRLVIDPIMTVLGAYAVVELAKLTVSASKATSSEPRLAPAKTPILRSI
ncbi:ArnT family glycosyltransferase [Granulicella aggregans]|jgi:hypothetical protein|uniref:ArnT family glycosyltransferase n=1 Tax=Granulicella aggregans TaxID=474949 RepID=UPI0021E06966|nr:glycosyltransferase family 39 protein [Granulicella aggregans]